jgi:hypothetical protein
MKEGVELFERLELLELIVITLALRTVPQHPPTLPVFHVGYDVPRLRWGESGRWETN